MPIAVDVAHEPEAVFAAPDDAAWAAVPEAVLVLTPQIIQPPVGGGSVQVSVKAVHDGEWVAIRLSWPDDDADRSVGVDTFRDAVAVGFPLGTTTPSPFMGDANNPVAIWQWAADLDANARGEGTFAKDYPRVEGVWTFPQDAAVSRQVTGWRGHDPVEGFVARGFGTLERVAQPGLEGGGTWSDGRWTVVVRRKLAATGDGVVAFAPGAASQLIVAVWDGGQDEVNGRKAVTMAWTPFALQAAP